MFQPRFSLPSLLLMCTLPVSSMAGCAAIARLSAPSKGAPFHTLATGMQDPILEDGILKATQKQAAHDHWKETFSKVKITSEQWRPMRNGNGIIVGRFVNAWVYATDPYGICTYQDFKFAQGYDGHNYLELVEFLGIGAGYVHSCDCE